MSLFLESESSWAPQKVARLCQVQVLLSAHLLDGDPPTAAVCSVTVLMFGSAHSWLPRLCLVYNTEHPVPR